MRFALQYSANARGKVPRSSAYPTVLKGMGGYPLPQEKGSLLRKGDRDSGLRAKAHCTGPYRQSALSQLLRQDWSKRYTRPAVWKGNPLRDAMTAGRLPFGVATHNLFLV
jgi:hypothetical protein